MKKTLSLFIITMIAWASGFAQWYPVNTTFPPDKKTIHNINFPTEQTGYAGVFDDIFGTSAVYKTIDGAITWNKIFDLPNLDGVGQITFPENENIGYLISLSATSIASLYKTVNGGNTWTKFDPKIIYPSSVANHWSHSGLLLDTVQLSIGRLTFINNNMGFACGSEVIINEWGWSESYGGIYKTVDGGQTWNCVLGGIAKRYGNNNFQDDSIYAIMSWSARRLNFVTSQIGYIIPPINFSGFFKTIDGGNTWYIWQPPSPLVGNGHFINTDTGYVHIESGTASLLRTIDGGQTWNLVTPPSINIGVTPPVFISDKLVFWDNYKSLDGGFTWVESYPNNGTIYPAIGYGAYNWWLMSFPNDSVGYAMENYTINGSTGFKYDRLLKYTNIVCDLSITTQPQSVSSPLQSNIQFKVDVNNPTNATYQWQTNIPEFGWLNYPNSTGNTFNIYPTTLQNHGQQFRAIVSSSYCRDTSDVAILTVTDTCTFTNHVTVTDTLIYNDTLTYNDTTYLTITDTTYLTITDTTYLTITDTVTVFDTTYVSVHDTLIIRAAHVGINAPGNVNTIKVYPNPANTQLNIDFGNYGSMNGYALRIDNNIGQTVFNQQIDRQQVQIDLSSWPGKGLYFLRITDPQNNIIEVKKILLQ